jgi:hypothetical protein
MTDQWLKRKSKSPTEYSETHPSYGCISISQVQGRGVLFGSEVTHQHFISITISEARRVVDEPREFVMSDRELIQVAMTQAQFAEMITSPNRGSGTPCTIERFTGDKGQPWVHPRHGGRPSPPEPEHYTKKYKNAMGERTGLISDKLKAAKEKADRLVNGEDKPTKENLRAVAAALYTAQMNLDQNLPYVMEEMEEGIEKRMSTAVSEFESYVAFSLQAKGLEHLAAQAPRLNSPEQKSLPDGSLESE